MSHKHKNLRKHLKRTSEQLAQIGDTMKQIAEEIKSGVSVTDTGGFSVSTDNSDIVERLEVIGKAVGKRRRYEQPFVQSQLQRVDVAMAKRCKLQEAIDAVVTELRASEDGGASLAHMPSELLDYFEEYPLCREYHGGERCCRLFASDSMLSDHQIKRFNG